MIGRIGYVVFTIFFGWPFMLINWVLRGTRASRQRQQLLKQNRQLSEHLGKPGTSDFARRVGTPVGPVFIDGYWWSHDRQWWWDGQSWRPR